MNARESPKTKKISPVGHTLGIHRPGLSFWHSVVKTSLTWWVIAPLVR